MTLASLAFSALWWDFFLRRTKKCTWNWSQDTCLGASLFSICLGMPIMSIWKRQVIHRPREYKLGKLLLLLVLSPYCTNSSGGPRVPCGDRWHSQIIQDLSNQSTTPLVSLVLPLLPAQRLLKNWVWDANSREHTRFHTTKKFNDLISIHLFQSKKRERSEHYLIE